MRAYLGEVAEWSIAAVLKTADVKASVGSNPTLSAGGMRTSVRTERSEIDCAQHSPKGEAEPSQSHPLRAWEENLGSTAKRDSAFLENETQ
jgi:hypothetical protein